MNGPILVNWNLDSRFVELVRAEVNRISMRLWKPEDPLAAWSEVWRGLNDVYAEGQILIGNEVGHMRTIIRWRVSNYFHSKCGRRPRQPSLSHIGPPNLENVESTFESPSQVAIQQEHLALIEETLSQMPPHWAAAVRSQLGYPGAPEWAELVKTSGTTRQNVAKRAKKGLRKLAPLVASFFPESMRDGRVNPGS